MTDDDRHLIVARFYRGVFDEKLLVLPCFPPWPKFVLPSWENPYIIEQVYLLAGQMDENTWAYLWDDTFAGMAGTG